MLTRRPNAAAALLRAGLFAVCALSAFADRNDRWIALLDAPAPAERLTTRAELDSENARSAMAAVATQQRALAVRMRDAGVEPDAETRTLLNAIFFRGSAEAAESIRQMPGVSAVVRDRSYRIRANDRATELVNAPGAWTVLGGEGQAGAGRRIGIIDTGVDVNHPALRDDSLSPPSGFPRASTDADRAAHTSSKVIVARSYVPLLVLGDNPADSRPDDLSARDRVGHGTAVAMLAAGRRVDGPAATIVGVAPKAFIGSYKVFGSPGVNDVAFTSAIARALEDALADGMDVVTLSLGASAEWGATDRCGQGTRDCDPLAATIERAVRLGLSVVVAAGNSGDIGFSLPTLGSVESPGTAPSAITVGAVYNAHIYYQTASVNGANVPANLRSINTRFSSGPVSRLSARVRTAESTGDDGRACRPMGNGSLGGVIALVRRGGCNLDVKVNNAQRAGATGVIFEQPSGNNNVVPLNTLDLTPIPSVLIGSTDGQNLRAYLGANPDATVTLDPAFRQTDAATDEVAYFSSQGPSIGLFSIKPEVSAIGTDLYLATQSYDPNGYGFSADGYRAVEGTSFAVPMVAGAVALVKQRNPNWGALAVKSAVVNSANPNIQVTDSTGRLVQAGVNATGAGKLDVRAAVNATFAVDPAALAFGPVSGGTTTPALGLTVANLSSASITVAAQVQQRTADSIGRVTVTPANFQLPAGQTTRLTVRVEGSRPNPGSYEGAITLTAGSQSIRVPYQYLVGDGVPFNVYALRNDNFISTPNAILDGNNNPLLVKFLDRYGVPVANLPVRWSVPSGGGVIAPSGQAAGERTDSYGVAFAGVQVGPELGDQSFRVEGGGLSYTLFGRTILRPTIRSGGIVDAASGRTLQGLAPGSYMSIYGSGLSEVFRIFSTPYLPLSLNNVSVSFDAPERRLSAPGRIHFVSDGQINVQIPWELQGLTSVQMKVSIGDISSAVFTVPLNEYLPALFEYDDSGSGRRLAAALDEGFRVVSGANAAPRGGVLQLFVSGLGRVSTTPESGEVSPVSPLSQTMATPEVRIGGRAATVLFSGLAPNLVGVYQVNVIVPPDAETGIQPLVLSIGGLTSQSSQIPVR